MDFDRYKQTGKTSVPTQDGKKGNAFQNMPGRSRRDQTENNTEPFGYTVQNQQELSYPQRQKNHYPREYSRNIRQYRAQRGFGERIRDFFCNLSGGGFPWRIVIISFIIIATVSMLVIFRKEITDFMNTLLSWTITLGIIIFILWLIFHRRRRY